jgi:hypothetical protein
VTLSENNKRNDDKLYIIPHGLFEPSATFINFLKHCMGNHGKRKKIIIKNINLY